MVRALLCPTPEVPSVNTKNPGNPGSRFAGFEGVPVAISVRVGRAHCTVGQLASSQPGDVIVLDRPLGAPFDLVAGDVELGQVEPVASGKAIALKLVALPEDGDDAGR